MKKHEIYQGSVEKVSFPNKGLVQVMNEELNKVEYAQVKNVLPGQQISFRCEKKRGGKAEGRLMEVLKKAPNELSEPACPHFGQCGGCSYQNLSYEEQLKLKSAQMQELFAPVVGSRLEDLFEGVTASPKQFGYRNKMEYTFGDEFKEGPLALGMHKSGSFYDILTVSECKIVCEDFNRILNCVLTFMEGENMPYYHRMRHTGFLRHLLVRRGEKTGELLVDLVTCWAEDEKMERCESLSEKRIPDRIERDQLMERLVKELLSLELEGEIVGILNTKNDNVADTICNEETTLLWGRDYFYEELLGLRFKVSPFSFFQTNSLGAEVLYETAREFIRDSVGGDFKVLEGKTIFDLYSGTGTIAQMMAPVAGKVVGVEIVEEAVEAAKENAKLNGLHNCDFIAGDVLKVLDDLTEKPDYIILDPPRDGIHPKALPKILAYGVEQMIYISCKPTSLARDLEVFQSHGYEVKRMRCVDMFPGTVHTETCVLLCHQKADDYLEVEIDLDELDATSAEALKVRGTFD